MVKKGFLSPEFQNHLWMVISSGAFVLVTTLMTLIATRLINLETAGVVAYAIALSNLLVTLIVFNANYYQIIDTREEFSFREYLGFRTITAALTSLGLLLFLLVTGHDRTSFAIIVLCFFIYLVDAYGNVFMCDFQQKGMVRFGARTRAFASFAAVAAFSLIMFIRQDVISSLALAGVAISIVWIVWVWVKREHFGAIRVKIDMSAIKSLIVKVFPIFVPFIANVYLINAPKYYLEAFVSNESVAVYAILVLPGAMFLLLVHTLLFGAALPITSEMFASGDFGRFLKRIHMQMLFIAAMAVPFLAAVYFLAPWFLSLLYGIDIYPYRELILLISTGSVFVTAAPVVGMALTIMRRQKVYMYSLTIPGAVFGAVVFLLVRQYGMDLAVYSNLIIFAPLTVIVYTVFRIIFLRETKIKDNT